MSEDKQKLSEGFSDMFAGEVWQKMAKGNQKEAKATKNWILRCLDLEIERASCRERV